MRTTRIHIEKGIRCKRSRPTRSQGNRAPAAPDFRLRDGRLRVLRRGRARCVPEHGAPSRALEPDRLKRRENIVRADRGRSQCGAASPHAFFMEAVAVGNAFRVRDGGHLPGSRFVAEPASRYDLRRCGWERPRAISTPSSVPNRGSGLQRSATNHDGCNYLYITDFTGFFFPGSAPVRWASD